MEYTLQDFIDVSMFQSLQDKLNDIFAIPSAITDNEGNILTATGWQDICTKFQPVNLNSASGDQKCDRYVFKHFQEANPEIAYDSVHGKASCVTPIIINGEHMGSFVSGQFFKEKPDIIFFTEQARKYGIDEKAYLEAVSKIPVWSEEQLSQHILMIKAITEILLETGYRNLRELEDRKIIEEQLAEFKHIELNLRKSENRFKQIVENSSDFIWEVDASGLYTFCSDKIQDILGYASGEVVGHKYFYDFFAPAVMDDMKTAAFLTFGRKEPFRNFVNPNIHKNGQIVILETSGSPILDSAGNLAGYRGGDTDITSRIRAAEDLREQEETLRVITSSVKDAIIMIDNDGKIIFWNDAATTIYGYTHDEIFGKNLHLLIAPEWSLNKHAGAFALFQSTGLGPMIGKTVKLLSLTKDQKEIPIELSLAPVQIKGNWCAVGVVRDITEWIESERSLMESEEKYKTAFKTNPNGILLIRMDGTVVDLNPVFSQRSGYSSEEAIGKTLSELNLYAIAEDRFKMIDALKTKGIVENFETLIRYKNGSLRTVLISASIFNIKDEQHILAIANDITERKELENELIKAKEKAEEASRLTHSLLMNMSHELRTPLNGILGFAGILVESLTDPEQKKMADIISLSGTRLMATLNSIMELAQVEADRTKMDLVTLDIGVVVTHVLQKQRSLFDIKGIHLIEAIESGVYADLDTNLLSTIIFHLAGNAIKYTKTGSVIVTVNKNVRNKAQYAVLKVKDTGIGISGQQLTYIFDAFRQGDEGIGRSYEGTGLGLTLCKKFTELMGGNIEVESMVGVGSTFTVRFPLSGEIPGPKQDQLPDDKVIDQYLSTEKPRVLIVEDNEANSDLMAIYLQDQFITDQADNGVLAVKMANQYDYDVILMDINLGQGLDGIEATKQIREIEKYAATPVIAVTGYFSQYEKKKIISQGFDDIVSKPFYKNSLISIIKGELKKKITGKFH